MNPLSFLFSFGTGAVPYDQLLALMILLLVASSLAFVSYHIYGSAGKIWAQAINNIGNKNITLTKDGIRVSVKELQTETYVDTLQKAFVDVWNQRQEMEEAKRRTPK